MKCSSGVTQASKNRSFTREGGLSERAEAQCDVPARTKQTNKIEKLSVVVRQLLAACSRGGIVTQFHFQVVHTLRGEIGSVLAIIYSCYYQPRIVVVVVSPIYYWQ